MPPLLDQALLWARRVFVHTAFMFWWVWAAAVALTAASESWWVESRRRRLLEEPDGGWTTLRHAVVLGLLSPPSRRRIFRQAKELLAADVSRAGVLAYLVSAQALLLWMLLFVLELNGPQPAIGQVVAVAAALAVLLWGTARIPNELWEEAREKAQEELSRKEAGEAAPGSPVVGGASPLARAGPAWTRPLASAGGQARWPRRPTPAPGWSRPS